MRTMILSAMIALTGCSQGTRQWYEKSEPQTCITIDPLSKKVMLFDNNGRAVTLKNASIERTEAGWVFKLDGLSITEKSVENRIASAEQDKTWFEGSAVMYRAIIGEGGIAGIVGQIAPGLNAWMSAHPSSSKDPNILQGVITSLIKEQMAKNLSPGG